jgi:cytochrome b pre-mRNA-processing protein 3
MILARWRARRAARVLIDHLHGEIVAAARRPALYTDCGVPDDIDGRFEMMVLHGDLLLRRLNTAGATHLAQDMVDRLFEGFDDGLREMSISDVGVAKRMTKYAGAFFGRAAAYGPALEAGDEAALAAALKLSLRALAMQSLLAETPLAVIETTAFRYPAPEAAP